MVTVLLGLALLCYLVSAAYSLILLVRNRPEESGRAALPTMLGVGLHSLSLLMALVFGAGWPLDSPSASFSFIGWALALFTLWLSRRHGAPALLSFVLPLVALTTLVAFLQVGEVPALGALDVLRLDAWLWLHASFSLMAVGALILASTAGVVYLLQERQVKSRRPGALSSRLPSLDVCDRLEHRSLSWGFVMLTVGIISGLMWIWSSPDLHWTWDLTRGLALGGWLLYLVVLYSRWAVGWRGRKAAYLTIVGGLSVAGILLEVLLLSGRFHPGS